MRTLRTLLPFVVFSSIAMAQVAPPTINTASLPNGNVSVVYSATLTCSSCAGYTWSVSSGFPPGLGVNASSGAISGTPTSSGFYGFTVSLVINSVVATSKDLSIFIGAAPFSITTTSLPSGIVGTFYSQAISATGGLQPYFFSIVAGSLPPGLGISSGGTISGTPTAVTSGSGAAFTVQGNDSSGQQAQAMLIISIVPVPVPTINTTTLPTGLINSPYAAQLTCSNCAGDLWGATNLPPGIGVNASTGGLSGTPTSIGVFSFQASLFGANGGVVASASLSITISPPGAIITTTSLPNGILGQGYSAQLMCSNCNNWTWSVGGGGLPAGLNVSTGGGISGTPSALGSFTFTVTLSPPAGNEAATAVVGNLSITIVDTGVGIVQSTLPVGFQNTPYSTTLTGFGGTPPYTWALVSPGTAGLTIGAKTGILSGTPTAAGTFSINVQITDGAGQTALKGLGLTVALSLSILTSSFPNGGIGVAYPLQTLQAGGGQPPYRWTVTKGTLPPGITLDGVFGRISGTPTTGGAFPFTLMVTDNQANTAAADLSITIGAAVTITISPSSLPAGSIGTAYSQSLTANGGTAPYSLAVTAGSLPAGLSLNGAVISGTPTTAATSNFTVTATDANQATGTAALSIVVTAVPAVSITTTSLSKGTVGAAYSQTLAATGGASPYTWSILTGTLPAGLTLNASSGAIAGTPTAAATSNFTVQVSDVNKLTAQQALSIVVSAAVAPLTVTPTTLPSAVVGSAYSQKLTAAGGVSPYTFALTLGSLPAGFTFSAGTISGTAPAAESGNFTITVTDSVGTKLDVPLSLTANNPPPPTVTVTLSGPSSGFSQQLPITVSIGSAYPVALTGVLSLTFAPSVTPATGVDDLLIQFASGGRSISFTIPTCSTTPAVPPCGTTPVFPAGVTPTVLTGTTAGTITVTTSLTASGSSVATTTKTILNTSGVPFINPNGVTLTQSPGGVTVTVTGFSSTRDMTSALFHFAPATGVTLTQQDVTVPLAAPFTTWWNNTAQSNPYGTQFTLTVPFTLSTQSTSIVSVTVTLTNSKGASNPVSSQ